MPEGVGHETVREGDERSVGQHRPGESRDVAATFLSNRALRFGATVLAGGSMRSIVDGNGRGAGGTERAGTGLVSVVERVEQAEHIVTGDLRVATVPECTQPNY